ncbi:MAG: insulinase family protein [Oscillospiraceae bacterium]|nr:insulinase family protein [Oscillospiraceae bacterium]
MTKINTGKMNEDAYFSKLPNGLAVYLIKKPGFSKKAALLGVNYGSDDIIFSLNGQRRETPQGTAHFLEHKLFDLPDGRNTLQLLTQMGASPNAFTSHSATAYYFTCNDNFMPALKLLFEFVYTPHFTPEGVEKEQGIIAQEISMRGDMPEIRLFDEIFTALYSKHPVRHPVIGTADSIKTITADTLHDCYNAFYRPANMVLTVVGDLDPNVIEDAALRLSPRERQPVPEFDCGGEPEETVAREKIIRAGVEQPMFAIGVKLVPRDDRLPWEINCQLALGVLAGPLSRLYGELYDKGLIGPSFSSAPYLFKKGGVLLISGRADDPPAVHAAFEKEIRGFNSIDTLLFGRVKRAAWGERMRVSDNPEALARSIALDYMSGADYFNLPRAFDSACIDSVLSLFSEMRNNSIIICETIKEVPK